MPWYVVTRLGVGIETDAFFASGALPQLIFLVASFSLTQVLVPLLATEDEKTFRRDAWGFFLATTGFFTLVAIILFVAAGYWVPLIVPGFSAPARQLAITLSRIQLLAMIGNASVVVRVRNTLLVDFTVSLLCAPTIYLGRSVVSFCQRN